MSHRKRLHKKNKKFSPLEKGLHWGGFFMSVIGITLVTAYGFGQTLKPDISLDSAPEEPLALVGVALANNLGTGSSRATEIPVNLPSEVIPTQDAIIRDATDVNGFFASYFSDLTAYSDLAQLDIASYLDSHENRESALEKYIYELESATTASQATLQKLTSQSDYHKNAIKQTQEDIKQTQNTIETAYTNRDSQGIADGVARLDELTLVLQDHTYGQLFSSRIGKEYANLIAYSQSKLAVITSNIPALVTGVSVNLPANSQLGDLENLNIFTREN